MGIAGTLGAAGLTRWFDLRQLRQRWTHDEAVRWLQDRQQAYGRLMGALDDWDVAVNQGVARRRIDALFGERRAYDSAEWNELRQAARTAHGVVELMAPESVRGLSRSAVARRQAMWVIYLADENADLSKMDEEWGSVQKDTMALREAMRADLGLGPDTQE